MYFINLRLDFNMLFLFLYANYKIYKRSLDLKLRILTNLNIYWIYWILESLYLKLYRFIELGIII